jgi:hypothetical protein
MSKHVEIILEKGPVNPYEDWDFLGTIVSWHPNYSMGAKVEKGRFIDEVLDPIDGSESPVSLKIYMRGDDSITTEGGRRHVGYIYVSKDRLKDEALADKTVDEVKEILTAEVDAYNHYHMGNCWGVKVYKNCSCCGQPQPDVYESCWGFYGETLEETGIVEFVHEVDFGIDEEATRAAWDKRFENV